MKKSGKERREDNLMNIKRLTKLFSSLFYFFPQRVHCTRAHGREKAEKQGAKKDSVRKEQKKSIFLLSRATGPGTRARRRRAALRSPSPAWPGLPGCRPWSFPSRRRTGRSASWGRCTVCFVVFHFVFRGVKRARVSERREKTFLPFSFFPSSSFPHAHASIILPAGTCSRSPSPRTASSGRRCTRSRRKCWWPRPSALPSACGQTSEGRASWAAS